MTDLTSANVISDLLRTMSTWLLDRPAFWILGIMYEIFFNVASAELFSNATIKNFYSRVQLIIGVFMVFKLAVTILQGIMNPDKFTDKRDGFSNIITRIIFSLVMLTVIVPINIPGINSNSPEYQIQLNNNGLLFGTLYSLQNRLLSNNTLGRLVLGTTDDATNTSSTNDDTLTGADKQAAKLERSANIFTSTILKGFLRINLLPEDAESRVDTGDKPPESDSRNWMCGEVDDKAIAAYRKLDASPHELLSLVNASCEDSKDYPFNGVVSLWKKLTGQERYVFAYIPILPAIVAFIFAFILLGFTVDIAVRSVKLAVLRLIAPIPIISYIDPKSAKDGAFASWVKVLTSTYLDLFIRLAVVYFVIFLIQDMIVNGIVINTGSGLIGIISFIFICLGLFFFAKQAPKFIRDVLGLKGQMSNIGLSALLGGTAALVGGGGAKGFALGAMQGAEGSLQATNQGKSLPLGQVWRQNSDMMAKINTGDKDARGGVIGRTMDRLNYGVRENRATQLGIGNRDVADATFIAKQRRAMADNTQSELDKIAQEFNNLSPNATQQERDSLMQRWKNAYDRNQQAQASAAKAESTAEKMDKDRGQLGAGPRIGDKRDVKYTVRQKFNNTFNTNFATSRQDAADRWNDRLGTDRFQGGTYRSPLEAQADPAHPIDLSNIEQSNEEILQAVNSHKRDLKNFSGTTDDDRWSSSGHGSGGGPGGGPGGPPIP